ncbi:T9SS type A sorting domain-containing protein [Anaerophaga thermohalophila]|uniref:T9SS type A sorting domain-containing protein n=1 Tax=Anaerophaga thermohalophila TaxID=177400 RepID=UPI000237C8CA|nr:T9SS type A sorting domain-containing protein [Anaerophaga thermohalophila]
MKKIFLLILIVLTGINNMSITTAQEYKNEELFGPNMFIFSPDDDMAAINEIINNIHDEMFHDEFSTKRYAFYFKPGNYTGSGTLNIAYYTHIGGLGKLPTDIRVSNIYTPAPLPNNNATCTFWRSAENLTVAGVSDGDMNTWFQWAVSQAAPLRRINSERRAHYQWWYDGWCSGGFTGDCYFHDRAGSWSQQQWYFRNTYVEKGSEDYSIGGWNLAYQGVEFGPNVNMANHSDNWSVSGGLWNNVSRVDKTPIIREKPFLYIGDDGRYKVFKPALRKESKGTSWTFSDMGPGETIDLLNDFYIVKPGTPASTMNEQLAAGKHLFITPGIYEISEPLHVTHPNTIILGTGYATLIPSSVNSNTAILVDDVDGVTIASLLFDAHYSSRTLVQVGKQNSTMDHSDNPTLLADLFFRVGGFREENVNVDIALEINSSDIIGDHFWIWRADHGKGVGWFKNTARNGLVVNGHYVTLYGVFNEHFQEYGTLWNGEKGRLYFYQNETPYDPVDQNDYMSHNGTVRGYAAYKVADHVNYHEASMLGIYDVLINTGGEKIAIDNSIEVPDSKGVKIHHACNVGISPDDMGGFVSVINGEVPSTYYVNGAGSRFFIIDYQGTNDPIPWERPTQITNINNSNMSSTVSIYPNPVSDYLFIKFNDNGFKKVTVSNMAGQVQSSKKINTNESILNLDLRHLDVGIYFVTLSGDGLSETFKVVRK